MVVFSRSAAYILAQWLKSLDQGAIFIELPEGEIDSICAFYQCLCIVILTLIHGSSVK